MAGSDIDETILQITDRIEKKLQETPSLDYLKSYTQSGQSTILVVLKESTPPAIVPDIWDKVRKKVDDIRTTLPQGIQGPSFNDGFGDTFGTIYAFTTRGSPAASCATMSSRLDPSSWQSRTPPRSR